MQILPRIVEQIDADETYATAGSKENPGGVHLVLALPRIGNLEASRQAIYDLL